MVSKPEKHLGYELWHIERNKREMYVVRRHDSVLCEQKQLGIVGHLCMHEHSRYVQKAWCKAYGMALTYMNMSYNDPTHKYMRHDNHRGDSHCCDSVMLSG